MKIITWDGSLSVGIERIDADHRRWVEMFNELFTACMVGVGAEAVGKTLGELLDYTRGHFAREEAFLAESGYADLALHKAIHDEMIGKVVAIEADLKAGADADLSVDVLSFLHDWLIHHIKESDLAYAKALRPGG